MPTTRCIVQTCPALQVADSKHFCSVHHWIASSPERFAGASKNAYGALMKAFVDDIGRGLYPKEFVEATRGY